MVTLLLHFLVLLDGAPPLPAARLTVAEQTAQEALIRYGLGVWRERLELPVQAVLHQEAASKADPENVEPLRELVKLYADLGREAAAMRTAKKVLELDPSDTRTASELGKLLVRSKRYGEASQTFKQAADQLEAAKQPARKLGLLQDAARSAELAQDWTTAINWTTDALQLLDQQRTALARPEAYQDARDVATREAELLEKLGDRLLNVKKFDEAANAFRSSSRIWGDTLKQPAMAARLQWNLSGVLVGKEQYEEALAATAKFASLGPDTVTPYSRLAEILRKLGRQDEVLGTLAQLRGRFPKVEAITWVLAQQTLIQDGDVGHREFQRLLLNNPKSDYFPFLVQSYLQAGQARLLYQLLNELDTQVNGSTTDEDDEDTVKKTGLSSAQQRAAKNLQLLSQAVKNDRTASMAILAEGLNRALPDGAGMLSLLQELASQEGRYDLAIDLANRAFNSDPTKYFSNYYSLLFRARRWREILVACDRAENSRGRGPNRRNTSRLYNYDRAVPLAELGRANEALNATEDVARRIVGDGRIAARALKMRVLGVLGRHEQAIQLGLETLPLCNNARELRELRLALYQPYNDTRQFAAGEKLLRDQLEVDPDDALFLNNLGYNLADEGRKLQEAEALIRRAIELDRDERARRGDRELTSGNYMDSLGWVLFRQGKLKEARLALELAAKSDDANWDGIVWDHLGDVAFRQQDTQRAREAWTKAAELFQNSHVGRQNGRRTEVLRKLDQTK